jgi:hypothetical protein
MDDISKVVIPDFDGEADMWVNCCSEIQGLDQNLFKTIIRNKYSYEEYNIKEHSLLGGSTFRSKEVLVMFQARWSKLIVKFLVFKHLYEE